MCSKYRQLAMLILYLPVLNFNKSYLFHIIWVILPLFDRFTEIYQKNLSYLGIRNILSNLLFSATRLTIHMDFVSPRKDGSICQIISKRRAKVLTCYSQPRNVNYHVIWRLRKNYFPHEARKYFIV